jgi:hypothetical protein
MSKALICLVLAVLAFISPIPLYAQGYESPPTLSAAKVVPPNLLQGPYHKIVGPVTVQGFLNRYQMQTKYGTFTVEGTELLRMRVHEVAATAQLEKVNSAETLVASAGRTALKPIGTAKDPRHSTWQDGGRSLEGSWRLVQTRRCLDVGDRPQPGMHRRLAHRWQQGAPQARLRAQCRSLHHLRALVRAHADAFRLDPDRNFGHDLCAR